MSLHMVKLQPDMPRLVRWAAAQRLLPARGEADMGYALHALLAAAFGTLAPKPFALQQPGQPGQQPAGPASLLAYSIHAPDALRDHAAGRLGLLTLGLPRRALAELDGALLVRRS